MSFFVLFGKELELVAVDHVKVHGLRLYRFPIGRIGLKVGKEHLAVDSHIAELLDLAPLACLAVCPSPCKPIAAGNLVLHGSEVNIHIVWQCLRNCRGFLRRGLGGGSRGNGCLRSGCLRDRRFGCGRFGHGVEGMVAAAVFKHIRRIVCVRVAVVAKPFVAVEHLVARRICGDFCGVHVEGLGLVAPIGCAHSLLGGLTRRRQRSVLCACSAAPIVHLIAGFVKRQIGDNADINRLCISCTVFRVVTDFGSADADCCNGHHGKDHANREQ